MAIPWTAKTSRTASAKPAAGWVDDPADVDVLPLGWKTGGALMSLSCIRAGFMAFSAINSSGSDSFQIVVSVIVMMVLIAIAFGLFAESRLARWMAMGVMSGIAVGWVVISMRHPQSVHPIAVASSVGGAGGWILLMARRAGSTQILIATVFIVVAEVLTLWFPPRW